jgi:hypothetical protein
VFKACAHVVRAYFHRYTAVIEGMKDNIVDGLAKELNLEGGE